MVVHNLLGLLKERERESTSNGEKIQSNVEIEQSTPTHVIRTGWKCEVVERGGKKNVQALVKRSMDKANVEIEQRHLIRSG